MQTQQQDIKKQLASFGAILEMNKGGLTQKPKPKPIELQQGITREKPPLVIPKQHPESIIAGIMDYRERNDMIKFLSAYQKTRPDWEMYRQKIPDELLEKWAKVLKKCRVNGFINPHIENNEIHWRQILGFKHNYQSVDKCTLCPANHKEGNCSGTTKYKNSQRMFKPCWEEAV